jgi:hypothetical protein
MDFHTEGKNQGLINREIAKGNASFATQFQTHSLIMCLKQVCSKSQGRLGDTDDHCKHSTSTEKNPLGLSWLWGKEGMSHHTGWAGIGKSHPACSKTGGGS